VLVEARYNKMVILVSTNIYVLTGCFLAELFKLVLIGHCPIVLLEGVELSLSPSSYDGPEAKRDILDEENSLSRE
jgi:hypothetical protein